MQATRECSVAGCDRPARRRDYCGAHYARLLRHGSPTAGGADRVSPPAACTEADCNGRPKAHGMCGKHYKRHLLATNPEYRDRKNEAWRQWAAENPEAAAANGKAWRDANPERCAELLAAWQAENPWHASAYSFTKRRRQYGLPDEIAELVDPDVLFERDGGVCQLCLGIVDRSLVFPDPMAQTVDHVVPVVDPACTHSYANTQLAHWDCNRRKNAAAPEGAPR